MKIKPVLHSLCIVFLLTEALASLPLRGADPSPANNKEVSPADTQFNKIDLDLPAGGTLGDALDILKKKYPAYAFILSTPGVQSVKVGEVRMRNTNLAHALNMLRELAGNRFGFQMDETTVYFNENGPHGEGAEVRVFNINFWIEGLPEGDVEKKVHTDLPGMITTTINTLNAKNPDDLIPVPSFKYFPEGKIFIVVGTSYALQVSAMVIDALPGGKKSAPHAVAGADAPPPPANAPTQ